MIVATQEDLFPTMPRNTVEPTAREHWNKFRREFDRLGGVLPPSIVAGMVGLSRQRVHQLMDEGKVRSTFIVDRHWVSLVDVLEYATNPKQSGGRPRKEKKE